MQVRVAPTPEPETERVETRAATVWIDPDGVHRVQMKPVRRLTEDDARAMQEARERLCGGQGANLLLVEIGSRAPRPSRGAQRFSARPEAVALTRAMAIVGSGRMVSILGNAFFKLSRPPYPTRLFATHDEARTWLATQR